MISKEALEKLDHTICLNTGIKWGVDDLDKIDCQTQEEAIECIDTIRKDLKIIKQALKRIEPMEVLEKQKVSCGLSIILNGICPKCHHQIHNNQKFCDECGQKLDWNK